MRTLLLFVLCIAGCGPATPRTFEDTGTTDAPEGVDGGLDGGADGGVDAPSAPDAPDPGVDGAAFSAGILPRALGCTARTDALLTFTNTGTSTWSAAAGHALAGLPADPLAVAPRIELGDVVVPPGGTFQFAVALAAPGTALTTTTRWQMARGDVAFGDAASADVEVFCETVTPADFDLASVTILGSPEVRDFTVTSRLTSLEFRPDVFHIDHTARGTWPPVVIADDGTEQEATVWVFFHIGGRWYATGGERLRPNQTDKMLPQPSWIGPDWFYDAGRWGILAGYVPSPGDLVGFMVVAGSTRADDHVIVRERTNVVLVPFPADGVTTTFPPFAWEE